MSPRIRAAAPALLAIAMALLASCAGRLSAKVGSGGDAELAVNATVPAALAGKFRSFALVGGGMSPERAATLPLFDTATVRKALLARPGVTLRSVTNPDPDSLSLTLSIADLGRFLAAPDLAGPGLIRLVEGAGERELVIRLERGKGGAIPALLPGLDPLILEALAPPAIDSSDISRAEYRQALASLLGEKAASGLDSAAVVCSFVLPGAISGYAGGAVEGSTWKFSLPLLDLLVLEKPLEYRVRWRRP